MQLRLRDSGHDPGPIDGIYGPLTRRAERAAQGIVDPPPTPTAPPPVRSDVATNIALGQRLAAEHGWTGSEWQCLYDLWARESGWRTEAHNPSGAHGIPQALPGSKMGPGWESDPVVQITWGLGYIGQRYGTPCGAWSHFLRANWY